MKGPVLAVVVDEVAPWHCEVIVSTVVPAAVLALELGVLVHEAENGAVLVPPVPVPVPVPGAVAVHVPVHVPLLSPLTTS